MKDGMGRGLPPDSPEALAVALWQRGFAKWSRLYPEWRFAQPSFEAASVTFELSSGADSARFRVEPRVDHSNHRFVGPTLQVVPLDDSTAPDVVEQLATIVLHLDTRGRLTRSVSAAPTRGPSLPLAPVAVRPAAERFATVNRAFAEGSEQSIYSHADAVVDTGVAVLRLGFRCNQNCGICWQGRDWPEPPDADYVSQIDELANRGVRGLTVTGGEPTLYRALPEIIQHAVQKHGMWVHLQTNAIRLANADYVRTLVAAGLESLFVSLHAGEAAVSDAITRAPGTFARTVLGTQRALEHGLRVVINCVVDRLNVDHLPQHAEFLVGEFVQPYSANPLAVASYSMPSPYFDDGLAERLAVTLDEVAPRLRQAADILHAARVGVSVLGTCGFPPCLFKDRPWLLRPSNPDQLSSREREGHVYVAGCEHCAAKAQCIGVRRNYAESFGGRGLEPFTEPAVFAAPAEVWANRRRAPVLPV